MTTHVGPPARMPELAREAIATKPDVVVAVSTVAILAVKEASSTVPIVMSFIGEDPIAKGLANSFARPGGSATGVAMLAAQMDGKRASLLHEFVPAARRIAILTGRPPRHAEGAEEAQRVARELGLETDVFYADEPADYVAAFAGMRTARSEALVIISAPDFFRDAALLSRLALEAGLPTVCEWASMARDGCLIGYGPNFADLWRRRRPRRVLLHLSYSCVSPYGPEILVTHGHERTRALQLGGLKFCCQAFNSSSSAFASFRSSVSKPSVNHP